jgi:hypothetical protein
MNYSLGNMLGGSNGSLNPDKLSLNLQFATDKTLTARKGPTPTFTRASTATFVGSDGLIQSAAINAARFDHDPVTLACRGLLIEESRTNLWTDSANLGVIPWTLTNTTTLNSNNTTSPDGLTTAEKFTVGSTMQEYGFFRNTFSFVSGTAYTTSCFFKANQITRVSISAANVALLPINAIFDLTGSGSIVGTPIGTASIQQLSNGWYRCSVSATALLNGITSVRFNAVSGTSTSYAGNSVDSFFAWGAQLEAAAFPTSYIPTTTASVVRSADLCSITGSAFTEFYNQSEGTFFVEADPRATTANATYLMANSGANTNQVSIFRTTTVSTFGVASGGVFTAQITTASANGSFNKIAGSYFTNDARAAFNGVLGTADTSVNVPTNLTRLNLGSGGTGSTEIVNGCISSIRYFKKRLANAKLQSITA